MRDASNKLDGGFEDIIEDRQEALAGDHQSDGGVAAVHIMDVD